MREFEQKRKIQKRIYSRFTIVVLVIVLGFVVHATYGMYQKSRESEQQLSRVADTLAELDAKKQGITEEIAYLNSAVGQEEAVRNRYALAKEGEQVVVIIDEEEVVVPEIEESFFESLWDRFLSLITF